VAIVKFDYLNQTKTRET